MKQTKPYGRAHWTADERAAMAQEADIAPTPEREPTPASAATTPDLFSLHATALAPRPSALRTNRWCAGLIYTGLGIAALCVFVLVRDSLLLAQILQQMSSEEAVMVCKEGAMHYARSNPLDMLLGRGHFVCTEWSIRRSMLSIPRPYY
ncbi:hypothetical protein RQP54_14255 [Curvibacter sp. APW13]|uniref:hypothetical protein n=1 Tax=Curvibacter sp. APW13 TaxID=3077236 RepID=UPI0028DDDE31|nr:hypothetical protein [Curvibacter sp. APW13]MDT8992031.1 hypothetical protein [Curvibacter sp. APW13]